MVEKQFGENLVTKQIKVNVYCNVPKYCADIWMLFYNTLEYWGLLLPEECKNTESILHYTHLTTDRKEWLHPQFF